MQTININNIEYYEGDELMKTSPIYFKKARNAREIIKLNKINEDNYTFGKYDKDNEEWNETDGKSKKLDKVLFKVEWCKLNIPELAENDEVKHEIEEAPSIICISEDERANDETGFMSNIEMRGERVHDKCYFKVKDVMALFEMPNLNETIIDSRRNGYIENTHYKYFNCIFENSNGKKKSKKELFLTIEGMRRLAFCSRKFNHSVSRKIVKWLEHFDSVILKNNSFTLDKFDIKPDIGFVYCVTSDILNAIKIGFWKGSIEGLRSRYTTSYGNNLVLHTFETSYPHKLEQKCHKHFEKYRITNELFDKKYINKYIEFIKKNVVKIDESEEKNKIIENKVANIEQINKDIIDNYERLYIDYDDVSIQNNENIFHTGILKHKKTGEIYISYDDYVKSITTGGKYFDDDVINIDGEEHIKYSGFIRIIMTSKSNKAGKFIKWASETLFTTHLGTTKQKDKLIGKMKGVSYESIKELFNTSARSMPCIYLTSLARVKELRDIMDISENYDDNDIVYKFGLTKDFNQRKNGHKNEYKELGNIDMKLIYFSFIDPLYISQAESELKNILVDNLIEYGKHKELVILSSKEVKTIKETYEKLALKYSGHTASFFVEKSNLELKIKKLEHDLELKDKDHKIELSEIKAKYQLELKDKESIIKEYEYKYKLKEQELKIREMELMLNTNKQKTKKTK